MRFSFLVGTWVLILVSGASAQELSSRYTFTAETFAPVAAALPEGLRAPVLADPKAFLEDYRPLLSQPSDLLVLVDKRHELPQDYEPADLTVLGAPLAVNRGDLKFRKAYLPALLAMDKAARKDGVRIAYASAFRSWAYQRDLFQRYVDKDGLATAERYSARPGRSQHQLGTVVDLGTVTPEFADTKAGQWVASHAAEYGFSLSFPQGQEALTGYIWEPWHLRFIGIEACTVQSKWFGGLQQRLTEFHAAMADVLRASLKK